MNIAELQQFFSNKPAEIAIDFINSDKNDCKLNVSISIAGEEFMKMGYDISFSQADGFIKDLQVEVDKLKSIANQK